MAPLIEFAFTAFAVYILYKLVFELILPAAKVTSAMRSKIKEMHTQQNNTSQNYSAPKKQPASSKEGEYIEFEEVK